MTLFIKVIFSNISRALIKVVCNSTESEVNLSDSKKGGGGGGGGIF